MPQIILTTNSTENFFQEKKMGIHKLQFEFEKEKNLLLDYAKKWQFTIGTKNFGQ